MSEETTVERVFAAYARAVDAGDVAGIVELYADDAWVRDPVDGEQMTGKKAIEGFYAGALTALKTFELTGPVRVSADGKHGAAPLRASAEMNGVTTVIEAIDVMTFDDRGKITSMIAYFGPRNVRRP